MDRYFTFIWVACLLFTYVYVVESCSCAPAHPQELYCEADFVILAKVLREKENAKNYTREYKILIRKEYKMSEKSSMALKKGRLLTADGESMCGVKLKVGEVYAISGKVVSLHARINLCGMIEKWKDLTKRQRKGLKLMYRQGCTCKIQFCPPHKRCTRTRDACNWETWQPNKNNDCQRNEGICLRSNSQNCIWSGTAKLRTCSRKTTVMHWEAKKKMPKKYNLPFRDGRGRKFGQ